MKIDIIFWHYSFVPCQICDIFFESFWEDKLYGEEGLIVGIGIKDLWNLWTLRPSSMNKRNVIVESVVHKWLKGCNVIAPRVACTSGHFE